MSLLHLNQFQRKGCAVLAASVLAIGAFQVFCPTLDHWDGIYIGRRKKESKTPTDETHIGLLDTTYYTLSTAATLGLGDITPHSFQARTITSLMLFSMLIGLVFV